MTSLIQGFRLENLKVNVGTKVTWINKDSVAHTVTAQAFPRLFDSGALSKDQSYSFTFSRAGTFPYFCAFHEGMEATAIVVP